MKYLSIDIETTGLDEKNCDIIQFAAVIDDLENPVQINKLPRFKAYFKKKNFKAEPGALALHAKYNPDIFEKISKMKGEYDEKEDAFYLKIKELPLFLKNFLTKNGFEENEKNSISITACGKNIASFDLKFLNKKIKKWGGLYFRHRTMDPAILYWQKGDKELPDMKTCFERAGIRKEVTHDACEDALDVIRLIRHKLLTQEKLKFAHPHAFAPLYENQIKTLRPKLPTNFTIGKEYNVYDKKINENGIDFSILTINDIGEEVYIANEYFEPKEEIQIDYSIKEDKELFREKINLEKVVPLSKNE